MTQGETTVITGAGSQTGTLTRWGDYTSMSVDPADGCTFWYTNEYIPANGTFNWRTRNASFTLPGCNNANNPVVTNPGNQTGTVGTAASLQLSASGGTPPFTWSATGLPAGLSINASSGLISGTPTTAGTSNVTATATDTASHSGSASFSWTINPVGGGCSSPGQKLGNPGFESGSAPWTATAGVIGAFAGQTAHSGTRFAWMDGYGTTHTDTLSQTVTIPAGCHATLQFWLHIDTAEAPGTAFDRLTVQLNSTTVSTFTNLNAAAGYQLRTFDVSSFAGQTVTLKFTGTEDVSLQTSFVVDDTALTAS